MIKVYPIEVEAVEDGRKLFTLSMTEEGVFNLELESMICKESLEELFTSIRNAVEILEIEK